MGLGLGCQACTHTHATDGALGAWQPLRPQPLLYPAGLLESEDRLSTFCVKQSASMGLSGRLAAAASFGATAGRSKTASGVVGAAGGFEYTQVGLSCV